jgi:polygalacturonase
MTDPISRRTALGLAGSAAFIPLLARPAFAQRRPYGTSPHPLPWAEARRIVATTRLPRFRNVNFDVRRFGAKGDGATDDTAAFEEAIRASSASGGGHVIVAPGTYVTGAIYLKSNVDLHLRSGATLVDRVSTDPSTAHSNTDGCNPECSDHVVIKNCALGAHDDNIAIKSGRDDDGRRVNVPSQNIVISGCVMNGNWGAITCGSEMTGGIRNVYAHNCTVVGATKFALYVKSNTLRGGFAQNINLDGFSGTFDRAFSFVQMDYNNQTGDHPPAFGPFAISRSSCTQAPVVFDVSGLPSDHVNGFRVANCTFDGVTDPADRFNDVDGISFTGVTINGTAVTS